MDDMTMFRVTYDGPALERSEMDARELAPALMAIADLLEASSRALYGDKAIPQVNVKGSFTTGSFNIDFATAVSWLKSVRDLFAGENATAIANGLAILGALGFVARKTGLFQALSWLRGRKITRVQIADDKATIYVDDEYMDVERETINLLRDVAVRQAADRALAPLDREGIDFFAAGVGKEQFVIVTKEQRTFFAAPQADEDLLLEDTRRMAFSIVSLAFKEDNKWRLSDGQATISALITDEAFLRSVNENEESFSKGDVLVCTVQVRQWQTSSGARTEYEITKVNEHRRAARQIKLPGLGEPSVPPPRRRRP